MNQRELFLQHVAQTSDAPLALEIVRAAGCKMWDREGKEYIDVISGIIIAIFSLAIAEYCYLITRKCDALDLDDGGGSS